MSLRPYQEEARDAVFHDWNSGILNVIVALPTGTGKTRVGMEILIEFLRLHPGARALWMAHTEELTLDQPVKELLSLWPDAPLGIVKAQHNDVSSQVVVATTQTLSSQKRIDELLAAGPIDVLFYDEAHHSVSPRGKGITDTLRKANPQMCHLGLTATPWRADGEPLREVYDRMSYKRNIQEMTALGWLTPANGIQVETGVNIGSVKVSRANGDFVAEQLADVLDAHRWHELVAKAWLRYCVAPFGEEKEEVPAGAQIKQSVVFTASVASSKKLRDELRGYGVLVEHIDGKTPKGKMDNERGKIITAFRDRKIQVITNCAALREGFDAPSTEAILLARPTQSDGLFTQMIGRGVRLYPGKIECLVLLFATTGARILTLFDLGTSKKMREAKEKAEKLGVQGISKPMPLFDDDGDIDGVGTYGKVVSLFNTSTAAWFRSDATFTLGLGVHEDAERILVILPPNGDQNWHLLGVARTVGDKRGPWKVQELAASAEVEELMEFARVVIERRGMAILSDKGKKWRRNPATTGQCRYLRKWDIDGSRLDSGEAAQVINHKIAIDVLRGNGYV